MKHTFKVICFLSIAFGLTYCSANKNTEVENKKVSSFVTPEFRDNGKTIDSIVKAYNCESVEYDNWTENDATDSCLTVCLINSTKAPLFGNINDPVFTAMATSIKKSLAKPQDYNEYYIVFVKTDTISGTVTKVHSAGMQIRSSEL